MKCSAINYNTTDIECKSETGDLAADRTMFLMKFAMNLILGKNFYFVSAIYWGKIISFTEPDL